MNAREMAETYLDAASEAPPTPTLAVCLGIGWALLAVVDAVRPLPVEDMEPAAEVTKPRYLGDN